MLDEPISLIMIGLWSGPESKAEYPDVVDYVDYEWDSWEREQVVDYLARGHFSANYMGKSTCRFCGKLNGFAECTDGIYAWPAGLVHYLEEHGVRLPDAFVQYVLERDELLVGAARDSTEWVAEGNRRKRGRDTAGASTSAQ